MSCQPALDCVRQESRQRQLDEIVEEPQHQQREWKSQDKSTKQRVPESVVGGKAKKILEIGCKRADQQS